VTPLEVMTATAQAGVVLEVDEGGQFIITVDGPGQLTPEMRQGIKAHKDQLVAALKLREVHRAMGFDETDVLMIETALLSGKVSGVTIVPAPAGGRVA
jgi:hypothetical protein